MSYAISIVDKLDSLVGFFLIDEKPTSSKDPFALRRAAIGLLRTIIENNLTIRLKEIINYSLRLYIEQGVVVENQNTERDLLVFFKERMRNILKEKKIKADIIEASLSAHTGDGYLDLFKKSTIMNSNFDKETGRDALYSYKRVSNILEYELKKSKKELTGRPYFLEKKKRNYYMKKSMR